MDVRSVPTDAQGRRGGIDEVTAKEYDEDLEANLRVVAGALQVGDVLRAAGRRVWIPKGDGDKTRPIGIPTFEDKVLQTGGGEGAGSGLRTGLLRLLVRFSARPFSASSAEDGCGTELMRDAGGLGVGSSTSRSFFDTLDHGHLREFLDQRVRDGVIRQAHRQMAESGRDGGRAAGDEATDGTPQGGVISPLLANIYLHEVLDRWFVEQVQPRMRGPAHLIRYADDFVMVFATESDARRVLEVLAKRFAKYGLRSAPGEDATDRIWPDPGAEERRGRWESADLRIPRIHPLLGKVTQGNAGGQAQDSAAPVCPLAQTRSSVVQAAPAQADRGPATVPLRGAAGALLVLRPDRQREGPRYVSLPACPDLALLAATAVAAQIPELGPICPPSRALSAPATEGRPFDLPPRSESMRLRSRMREICTSGSVGGPGG